ncbi:MAG: rsbP 3 [Ilumatobacteraceae bacterium]|nr:rsbP 3 [Ilumatobacteraceae bacterium]
MTAGSGDAVEQVHAPRDDDVHALYEHAPCGYLSTTADGTIIKVNQTLLDWTGHQRADLVGGRRFVELLTAGGRIFHETHYSPMLRMQRTAREIALDIVRPDGSRLPVLVNSVVDRSADGEEVIRSAIFDATERRAYERELVREKERAERSERRATVLAATLQRTLIPPAPPTIPGLDIAAAYRPAGRGDEIGGDFYDVFQVAPDDWAVVLGDVQGKGVAAAVVTALLRYSTRAAAVEHRLPSDVLRILNTVLLRDDTERLCTAVVVRLRSVGSRWTMTLACAGHPLPLLGRAREPAVAVGRPGPLLGFFEEVEFADVEITVRSGDALVLYTDGVSEARRGDAWFGEQRISDALATYGSSATALADGLLHEVLDFEQQHPRDDIGLVAIRVP